MFSKRSNVKVARARTTASTTEVYLRNDIGCGVAQCDACKQRSFEGYKALIDAKSPIMITDTNILLHNINLLEDSQVRNIIFLGTVLSEVQNRNKSIYSRVQQLIADDTKACYVFPNDRHEGTFSQQKEGEGPNDYNDRLVRVAALWLARHIGAAAAPLAAAASSSEGSSTAPGSVYLVTHDTALRAICEAENQKAEVGVPNFFCVPLKGYIKMVAGEDSARLLEMSAYSVEDGMKETPKTGNMYFDHVDVPKLSQGILEGRYFKGKLRVGETSCFFGEIRGKWEKMPFDRIIIPGRVNMNRALHDDVVGVELLPVTDWRSPNKKAPPLPEGTTMEEAIAAKYTPSGRVAGILEAKRRQFCGSISTTDAEKASGAAGDFVVMFQPKNPRIPRIRMRTRQVDDLKDKRLVVIIDEWPAWSSMPVGHYIEILGTMGDRDTEAKVILMENDIPHYDFSQAVYDCLPKGQWSVEPEEEKKRLDLRDLVICSVDPLGCRDIDDALHARTLANGNIEVGVHIADVTHFVKEHSAIDLEASKRCTSVYLVDRRINMLPQLLTENLCSIVEGEDRYAFSILWEFDKDMNVVRDWYGKTIIRSSAALYYGDAQKMIDDPTNETEIAKALRHLMRISKYFKGKREDAGALFLASQEFKYKIDNDHLNSTDMVAYQTFDANSMIEEWMLAANAAAASKIYSVFPRWTLLRRHQPPVEGAFDNINEAIFDKVGMRLDPTNSLTLNQSLNKCIHPEDPYFNTLIRMLTTRCLRQAQYFSSGDIPYAEFMHFGLAMPIYTHFTSPIRRYADVIAHRQLAAAVKIAELDDDHTKKELMEALAETINYRHEHAQKAGRDSQNFFTGHYLKQFEATGIPIEDGYIVRITDSHIFIMVPKFGQENKIERELLPQQGANYKLLDKIRVKISVTEKGDTFGKKLAFAIYDPATNRSLGLEPEVAAEEEEKEKEAADAVADEAAAGAPGSKKTRGE